MANSTQESGPILDRRFKLGKVIGRGPSGVVYAATDLQTNELCAVKRLHAHFFHKQVLKRVQNDALAAARLGHPSILAPYHISFEQSGSIYLVTQLIQGESLLTRLQRGPLSLTAALTLFDPLAAALQAAHEAGLFHGAITPTNVLCVSSSKVVLTDFGMCHLRATPKIKWGGSMGYAAPETFEEGAELCSARGDVFSLGALAFECLTGQRMFSSTSLATFLASVATPPRLGSLLPMYEHLDAVLEMACVQEPLDRFANAGALWRALQSSLLDAPEGPEEATELLPASPSSGKPLFPLAAQPAAEVAVADREIEPAAAPPQPSDPASQAAPEPKAKHPVQAMSIITMPVGESSDALHPVPLPPPPTIATPVKGPIRVSESLRTTLPQGVPSKLLTTKTDVRRPDNAPSLPAAPAATDHSARQRLLTPRLPQLNPAPLSPALTSTPAPSLEAALSAPQQSSTSQLGGAPDEKPGAAAPVRTQPASDAVEAAGAPTRPLPVIAAPQPTPPSAKPAAPAAKPAVPATKPAAKPAVPATKPAAKPADAATKPAAEAKRAPQPASQAAPSLAPAPGVVQKAASPATQELSPGFHAPVQAKVASSAKAAISGVEHPKVQSAKAATLNVEHPKVQSAKTNVEHSKAQPTQKLAQASLSEALQAADRTDPTLRRRLRFIDRVIPPLFWAIVGGCVVGGTMLGLQWFNSGRPLLAVSPLQALGLSSNLRFDEDDLIKITQHHIAQRNYQLALGAAELVLRAYPDNTRARRLADQASELLRASAIYGGFLRAADRQDADTAAALYAELPADSPFRANAWEPFLAVRTLFVNRHLNLANAALAAGDCEFLSQQVDELRRVTDNQRDPDIIQAQRLLSRCRRTHVASSAVNIPEEPLLPEGTREPALGESTPGKMGGEGQEPIKLEAPRRKPELKDPFANKVHAQQADPVSALAKPRKLTRKKSVAKPSGNAEKEAGANTKPKAPDKDPPSALRNPFGP